MPEVWEDRLQLDLNCCSRVIKPVANAVPLSYFDGLLTVQQQRMRPVERAHDIRRSHTAELPGAVLASIFAYVTDTRTRNCLSLVCRDWYYLERQSRTAFILRGNLCNFVALPHCFQNVTSLDISKCSPWGYSLFQPCTGGEAVGQILQEAFPAVTELTVYVRNALDTRMVAKLWPQLESVKLVRWHQRPADVSALEYGAEIEPLFACPKLRNLDTSDFYCWTEDVDAALDSGSVVALNLTCLNLLKLSPDGFKSQEVVDISAICSNLEEFFVICQFNPRLLDPLGDNALEALSANCPRMRVVHLVDAFDWGSSGHTLHDDDAAGDDAKLTCQGLESLAKNLPLLQDFALLPNYNVRDSRYGVEALCTNCPKLTSLQLSRFHGLCTGLEQDGLALGKNLEELSVKCSVDFYDRNLISIAKGCRKLAKLSLRCCRQITEQGLSDSVSILSQTLVDVEISGCRQLPTVKSIRALEPVRNTLQRLSVDCVWNEDLVSQQLAAMRALKEDNCSHGRALASGCGSAAPSLYLGVEAREIKLLGTSQCNGGYESFCPSFRSGSVCLGDDTSPQRLGREASNDSADNNGSPDQWCWRNLRDLSIWIGVGNLLSPLPIMGLGNCPALTDVTIKVEGDCKALSKPAQREWGLAALSRYSRLTKLNLDLGRVISHSMCPPEGHADSSTWERHYLSGIAALGLQEINYCPPWDKELNIRGMSLPGVGHLSQCLLLRKLIVHGSAHEHFLSMLHRNTGLRDFQLRWDFHPAPEYESSNEVRLEACRRFEDLLTKRRVPD